MAPQPWRLLYSADAVRDLDRLETSVSKKIVSYLEDRVLPLGDPRATGKALKGSKWGDSWRYRWGNYRIIVRIIDREVVILVLRAGDRKNVY